MDRRSRKFSVVLAYLYHSLSQQHGQAKEAWVCFAVCKAICLSSEIVLLVTHSRLRQQYRTPFRAHMAIRVGIDCACWLPIFCNIFLQQYEYEFGMALMTYQLEMCFWVGYWIEWWTGITLRIYLAIFGDLAEISAHSGECTHETKIDTSMA
ncbi:hypothetical protein PG984_006571 [Apiospora sp. TS-2023a]